MASILTGIPHGSPTLIPQTKFSTAFLRRRNCIKDLGCPELQLSYLNIFADHIKEPNKSDKTILGKYQKNMSTKWSTLQGTILVHEYHSASFSGPISKVEQVEAKIIKQPTTLLKDGTTLDEPILQNCDRAAWNEKEKETHWGHN